MLGKRLRITRKKHNSKVWKTAVAEEKYQGAVAPDSHTYLFE